MSKTLYIAGPMTGLPEYNYPAFREAETALRGHGFDVLNPVNAEQHNTTGQPQEWDWYMRHALRMVLDADAIALLSGWEGSKGAKLECVVAQSLELPIHTLEWWTEGARLGSTNWPDRPAYEPIVLTAAQAAAWEKNSPETVIGNPACVPEREPRFADLWEDEGI